MNITADGNSFAITHRYDGASKRELTEGGDTIQEQAYFKSSNMNVINLGKYSNSQNGVVISNLGISPCIAGGGKGHDSDVPKILINTEYELQDYLLVSHRP